ncbi:MAG: hypothetical protein PHY45_17565 [Rhodocyclaceae bacterium]|nr:hypothetical protein [Rhodocyclaceae bacterium]
MRRCLRRLVVATQLGAAALGTLASLPARGAAAGEQVVCRYTYGGESRDLVAAPVASPYAVPAVAVGSYFKFRVVFQKEPADLAAIKVYVYADRDEGAVPLHQATYDYPPAASGARYGFTGLNFVYEPVRDGELQYWCRLQGGGAAAP